MKNYITVVVLTFLVIVQGGPSFEEVLEYNNELANEDSVHLTDDNINLKRNDNVDAIGTMLVNNKFKRFNLWENLKGPASGSTVIKNALKDLGKIIVNSENKVQHPVDNEGKISDIIVAIAKNPLDDAKGLIQIIPKILSVEKDLNGNVQCHDFICNIILLGIDMTLGYDANSGLYLYIEFLKMMIMHVKVPISGIVYCDNVELPKHHVNFCIHADNVQLSDKRACVDLGFTFLGYIHTFPDICLHG